MAVSRNNRHGQTANPALIGVIVGAIVWILLIMSGNDEVGKLDEVSRRADLAILALMKEQCMWVALIVGGLTYFWAWRMRQKETEEGRGADSFREWSAGLPQWKPVFAHGETAAFVVPLARVESGEYQRREPAVAAVAAATATATAPPVVPAPVAVSQLGLTPVANTRSVPVSRLMPLQQMVDKFAAQFVPQQTGNRMPLVPTGNSGGLVRAARVELPAALSLDKVAGLPRTELEQMAGECYRRQGFDVVALGQGDDDSGVDLLCQRRGEVVIVKCVATAEGGEVSVEQVRELLSLVMGEGATRGIFLTTGSFSRKATKFAHQKGRGRIELINGRQFGSLVQASAAGAGASPACPCCGGRMKMEMEKKWFGRSEWLWDCEADECGGVIRQGDAVPDRKLLAA